ncbi:amino acid ABC transporter permease [Rhizobium sp. RMa-01]|uniref:amino acid ABC transporter permease n=1 Tax=unclassified Rhizobium TaxID=2613769 RepID=UPI0008D9E8A8|nr:MULTISPECIES: amino acid ABC transporter permease [unclassified Rhizobium]OHV19434.1 ABC transporter permease [Rhizobium sp. RSm-3]RVU09816.1 amino acid ABC transporter permease [Rhizobium sp. RMa-01]
MNYKFHWTAVQRALPDMLYGAVVTLEIAIASMVIGVVFAVLLALAGESKSKFVRGAATTWIELARNTPALFQIYMFYFGLGSFGIQLGSMTALLAGIAFNNAGYLAETFRGGLRAIPPTQTRAARSLGMGPVKAFRLITFPQLIRVTFYPITNQMVWAILLTSLGVVVGLNSDLNGVTQEFNVKTYRTFEFYVVAAFMYYAIAKFVTLSARLAAWRLFRY